LHKFLPKLKNNNAQREYLLTDILGLVSRSGGKITDLRAPRTEAVLGINNLRELAACSESLRLEKIRQLMDSGVQIIDPKATYVDWYCRVAPATTIYPHVLLEGETEIGAGSVVRSFSRITNCRVGQQVTILESSILVDSEIGSESSVGPGAHVRAGSVIGRSVRIGNYVEVKNSRIGRRTKAAHLTYLGDAMIGKDVNIGAGTITCNYDGVHKNQTYIENGVFVGSGSQLIAPVRIGAGAYIAAGSTITEDVPANALAIARGRQILKPDWAQKRKKSCKRHA
jgi:bifunctional UDP-N-acetylglucosamine pyrophosphorylase/glucosamine-1-phosphate N-acetyltransferase